MTYSYDYLPRRLYETKYKFEEDALKNRIAELNELTQQAKKDGKSPLRSSLKRVEASFVSESLSENEDQPPLKRTRGA